MRYEISSEIVAEIENHVEGTEFDSVEEYLEFILEELNYQLENNNQDNQDNQMNDEEVENRLKSLGYLT